MALPVTPAETLNQQRVRRANNSATFSVIPIIYGDVLAEGRIFAIGKSSPTDWIFGVLWGFGELTYVRNVRLDGKDVIGDTTVTSYRGTAEQQVDPTLAAAITDPQYLDRLNRIAYSVISFSQDDYGSIPNFTAEVGGIAGTSNPARAYRDLVTNAVYGLGESVDEDAQREAEIFCDAFIDGTEVRHSIGLVLEQSLAVGQWLDILAEYAGCWSNRVGGKFALTLNHITEISTRLTDADVVRGGVVAEDLNLNQLPTTVDVSYTEISDGQSETRNAVYRTNEVLLGIESERVSNVAMPGITRYSEAFRLAQKRQRLLDNQSWKLTVLDSHLGIERGDRITYTDSKQGLALDLHVVGVPTRAGNGLITLECYEYRASDYSETVTEAPTFTSGKRVYE